MNIELNLGLMILVFVLFIACLILLNKWLYKPLLEFMDNRNAKIANDIKNANAIQTEIENINSEIESILEDAKKKASEKKEKLIAKAKSSYDAQISELQTNNERNLSTFKKQLEKDKNELKSALLARMPEFQTALDKKIKS